jgi:predicted O-methyltransferase YrrM
MMDTAKARELLKTKNLTEMDITPFQQIPFKLKSQGRPRFHAMLNALARCMSPEEIYLEVGTYQGGSTIGALLDNQARSFAVEDFSEFYGDPVVDNTRVTLEKNLRSFGVFDRVTIWEGDFHKFFDERRATLPPVGLYYYDAQHAEKDTLEGLEYGFPHVVTGGFIVADDISWDMVSNALNRFIGLYSYEVKVVFAATPCDKPGYLDDDWWNGCMVIQKISQ